MLMHYFAYGSNMHPLRLRERISHARIIAVVEKRGFKLSFAKVGSDNSGKCTFHESGDQKDILFGVVYEIDTTGKTLLDEIEGLGRGYDEANVEFVLDKQELKAFAYQANLAHLNFSLPPFDWYKDLVLSGAQYHALPDFYIANIAKVHCVPDPNRERALDNKTRLDALKTFSDI